MALFTALSVGSIVSAAGADAINIGSVVAVKVNADPEPSRKLDEAVWQQGLVAKRFIDLSRRTAADQRTSAYLLYDDTALYIAFRCDEREATQRVSSSLGDLQAGAVDYVQFSVDPTGDGTRIYRFMATANGIRSQYSSESARYNPSWSAWGTSDPTHYEVRMTIPFASLRLRGSASQNWKINFWRHVALTNDDYTWAYDSQSTDMQSDSRYWGTLSGLSLAKTSHQTGPSADVYMLGSLGIDRTSFDPVPNTTANVNPRLTGADINVPITGTTALVATINPDFSNIERDQFTIAPQEFRQLFTEYRPFFAKGATYVAPLQFSGFSPTNITLLYTPALGVFYEGLKLEGTEGQNQFGVLDANGAGFNTRAAGYQFATPDRTLTFALQGVSAGEDGLSDTSGGASALYENARSGFFTNIERLFDRGDASGTLTSGSASLFSTGIHTSHLLLSGGAEYIGPNFNPLQGYVQNTDISGPFIVAQYSGTGIKELNIKSYSVMAFGDRFLNAAGVVGQADAGWATSATTRALFTVGLSQSMSELTTYASGFPIYSGRETSAFDSTAISLGYRDGTRSPIDFTYSLGPFAQGCAAGSTSPICTAAPSGLQLVPAFNHQISIAGSFPLGSAYSIGLQYSGSVESASSSPGIDSQWLRRLSISRAVGPLGTLSLTLREISGTGGNALPGTNLSIGYSNQFKDQSQLYIEYGSPDSVRTLNRYVIKYVRHIGKASAL